METIAVYSEHPVKVYGLRARRDHSLLRLSPAAPDCGEMQQALSRLEGKVKVSFVGVMWDDGTPQAMMCLPTADLEEVCCLLEDAGCPVLGPAEPVALFHLQGPHFGDRFGIMHLALEGLAAQGVWPRAVAGVVHSLFLAVADSDCDRAQAGLSLHFVAPGGGK